MARNADTSRTSEVTWKDLHDGDIIIDRANERWHVHKVTRRNLDVQITVMRDGEVRGFTGDMRRIVVVQNEHECDCNGSGMYVRGFENDRPVGAGTCFRCRGKGYQTRADVIRNITYWNKYARVGA